MKTKIEIFKGERADNLQDDVNKFLKQNPEICNIKDIKISSGEIYTFVMIIYEI